MQTNSRANWNAQRESPGGDGVTGKHSGEEREITRADATHAAPEHAVPIDRLPLTTSQYVPAGRQVMNVDVHTESWLLIATNPSEP